MTRFYFVILIILSFSFGNFSEAASKVKKQNSKSSKKNETKTKNFADNSINFLTIEELGRLDSLTRTRYIIAFREAIVELSKIQMILGSEVALLPNKKSGFIAALLGEDVFAADGKVFERGTSEYDRCIYGGNLQKYSGKSGGANLCEKPTCGEALQNSWLAENKKQYSSNSISCNFATFGIQMCVTPGYNSTKNCNDQAETLRAQNRVKIDELKDILKTDDWLKSDISERAKKLDGLVRYAYDPTVMGHLIKFYVDVEDKSKFPQLSSLSDYDEKIKDLKKYYFNIREHCNKKLSDSAIASFKSDNGPLAGKRRSNLSQVKKKGHEPTVGNSLQRDECVVMLGKYDLNSNSFNGDGALARMEQGVNDALGTYQTQPEAEPVTPPVVETPPAPLPTPEPEEDPNKIEEKYLGCSPATDMLSERGMQCAKCIAQHSLSVRDHNNYHTQNNNVSEKWLSLLSTMSHQCDGIKHNSQELAERALKYVQAFGSCGTNIYDFNDNDKTLKNSIKQWQTGNLNKTDSEGGFFSKSNFEKVYGVSLSEAKRLFCEKPKDWSNGNSWEERYSRENENRRWAQRRWLMYQRHGVLHDTNHGQLPEDGATPSLYAQSDIGKCIQSIYLREGTDGSLSDTSKESRGRCQGFENLNDSFDKAVEQMFLDKPVVAVEKDGNCFVSHTARRSKDKKNPISLTFTDPQGRSIPQQHVLVENKSGTVSFSPNHLNLSKLSVVDTTLSSYCPDDRGRSDYYIPSASGASQPEMRKQSTGGAR